MSNTKQSTPSSTSDISLTFSALAAFGAGTVSRFLLLVSFIIVDSAFLSVSLVPDRKTDWEWQETCYFAVGEDVTGPAFHSQAEIDHPGFLSSCLKSHGNGPYTSWIVIPTAIVFVVAAAHYLLLPAWRLHRRHLIPVDLQTPDELASQLREMVTAAGLLKPPEFVIDVGGSHGGAVVFGRLGRYTVCLDADLLVRNSKDRTALRDVVLHELAHIRNHDVDLTYATVALWRSFLVCIVLPALVKLIYGWVITFAVPHGYWHLPWQWGLQLTIRFAVLLVFTYLVRADILRTREFYADAKAASGIGPSAFAWWKEKPPNHRIFRVWQRIIAVFRTHPNISFRRRFLLDPTNVYSATALPMFLTGVVVQVTGALAPSVLYGLGLTRVVGVSELVAWLIAAVVVLVTGTLLWRGVGFAILTDRQAPSGLATGTWLGIGFAVGELLSFRTTDTELVPQAPGIVLALVIAGPVFTYWVTQCTELWLREHRGRSIRLLQILILAVAFATFGAWYDYWMTGNFVLLSGEGVSAPGGPSWYWRIVSLTDDPKILAADIILWLFPLVVLLGKQRTPGLTWVERTLVSPPKTERAAGSVSLRPATVAAVCGTALCCLAIAWIMTGLHTHQPPAGQRNGDWVSIFELRLSIGLLAAVAATAIGVGIAIRRYQLVFALAAAAGTIILGVLASFGFTATDGCIPHMQVMMSVCAWQPHTGRARILELRGAWEIIGQLFPFVFGSGIPLAAIGALLGAALAQSVRHLRQRFGIVLSEQLSQHRVVGSLNARRLTVVAMFMTTASLSTYSVIDNAHVSKIAKGTLPITFTQFQPPVTPALTRSHVTAWEVVGGWDKITKLVADFNQLATASQNALNAWNGSGRPTVDVDPTVFEPICAAYIRDSADAAAFIPIPDPQIQDAWGKTLTATSRTGNDCLRGLQQGDSNLFNTGMIENISAKTAYESFKTRLAAATRP